LKKAELKRPNVIEKNQKFSLNCIYLMPKDYFKKVLIYRFGSDFGYKKNNHHDR